MKNKNGNGSSNRNGSSTTHGNAARKLSTKDEQFIDEMDALVRSAALGDHRAISAIAIAMSPMLIVEARKALGPAHDQDDADVLQELFLKLLEKGLRFPQIRGAGTVWLQRMVRLIAKDWVRKKGPPPGMAG
jgi:DNA-directed RNA polymerase specialized sigma24 family protein